MFTFYTKIFTLYTKIYFLVKYDVSYLTKKTCQEQENTT